MDLGTVLNYYCWFQVVEYGVKVCNWIGDKDAPSGCESGFCNIAHSIYATEKAKILLALPFPLDVAYAICHYRKSK